MSKEQIKTTTTNKATNNSTAGLEVKRLPIEKASKQEIEAVEAERFTLADLSPQERERAEDIAAAVSTLAMKGLLHRLDPKKYPVPANSSSVEARAAKLAKEIPAKVFARLRPRLEKAVSEPARMSRIFGKLKKVDLQKADFSADFKRLTVKPVLKTTESSEDDFAPASVKSNIAPQSVMSFNRLHLILRKLHCVEETDPKSGDDDMILGGVLIGASGNVKVPKAFVAGHFDSGDIQDFGELFFGQYNINATNGYPKSFYCIFKLVESDSDDKEVAEELTATLSFIANVILSAFFSKAVGEAVGSVMQSVGAFFSGLIDEDEFPPFGIRLKMNSANPFGGSDSANLRTGNIRAHGGTYRIGFKWSLNA